jgi:hydrogenase-4 component E
VLVSFMLLYQDRMSALLERLCAARGVLALSVAWQSLSCRRAPHLYVTAFIALGLKAMLDSVGVAAHRPRLDIHREVETAVGIGLTMLAASGSLRCRSC